MAMPPATAPLNQYNTKTKGITKTVDGITGDISYATGRVNDGFSWYQAFRKVSTESSRGSFLALFGIVKMMITI